MEAFTDFYRLAGAILVANLLTAAFIWAAVKYAQRERAGAPEGGGTLYLLTMVVVLAVGGGAVLLTT